MAKFINNCNKVKEIFKSHMFYFNITSNSNRKTINFYWSWGKIPNISLFVDQNGFSFNIYLFIFKSLKSPKLPESSRKLFEIKIKTNSNFVYNKSKLNKSSKLSSLKRGQNVFNFNLNKYLCFVFLSDKFYQKCREENCRKDTVFLFLAPLNSIFFLF